MKKSKILKLYQISSYLLMLGVIHSALTPVFYKSFSVDALWFFGTGLSLVFLSMLNIAASRILEKWVLKMTLIANIIGSLFSASLLFLLTDEPQAYLGLAFHLIVLFACMGVLRKHVLIKNKEIIN